MSLTSLTRDDTTDSPFEVTERNIEVAAAYALRTARACQRRAPSWMDPVRFEEAAVAAVMRAARNYRPDNEQGASFFTYCHSMVRGACMEEDRKQCRKPPPISIELLTTASIRTMHQGEPPEGGPRISDTIAAQSADPGELIENNLFLRDVFQRIAPLVLDQRERDVLLLRYVRGVKQKDVATHFKVTPGRIHQIEEGALAKIREFLEAEQAQS